ncbi:MAG: NUDIX domain-containing protein [Thermoplasmata archaeon]|nr:NUDIX domain-containing protein [Thermoplasmata archaeon]
MQGVGLRPGVTSGSVTFLDRPSELPQPVLVLAQGRREPVTRTFAGYLTEERVVPPEVGERSGGVVGGLDSDLFREGEPVTVDGASGTADLPKVEEVRVVTAFLQRRDRRILLLRRSARVGSFRGAWAAVSGYLEDSTALGQARREILEETGIPPEACRLESTGPRVYARDRDRIFVIEPFRFAVECPEVRLDWEHTELEWVFPDEIRRRSTVPKLDRVWAAVAPQGEPSATPPARRND